MVDLADKKKDPAPHDDIMKELEQFDKKYAESVTPPPGDDPVAIRISEDEMKVYVTVIPPLDATVEVTKETVVGEMKKVGVVHGIDDEAINDIFTYGSFNVEVLAAKGTPPSDGTSATIEYKFDSSGDQKIELKTDEHGNVDHKAMNMIKSVEEGAVLAIKIPSIPGAEGMTCTGKKLPAKSGRDVALVAGENARMSDDGLQVFSTTSGQPLLKDNKVSVSSVYEVKGDVDYKTGNVNFKGTVVVAGNVMSDFVVEATDDIEIRGNIDKAFIKAGGDVRINGGLYGNGEGKISAGGSVTIRSIESGIIDANRNIVIQQSSRNSILMAGEDIMLVNPKGSITGGKAACGHHYDLANLGSPSFTETVVEVGVNPKIKQVFDDLNKKLEDNKVQIEKVANNIKTIKSRGENASDKEKELMKKLVPAYHALKAAIDADGAKVNFLREKMNKLSAGRCKVRGKTFPGVKIMTSNASMAVRTEINHSSFYEQNEQVIVGPY